MYNETLNIELQEDKISSGSVTILNTLNHLKIQNNLDVNNISNELKNNKTKDSTRIELEKYCLQNKSIKISDIKENSNIDNLKKALKYDNILIVNIYNPISCYSYFSLIYKIDEISIYLKDPIFGLLRYTYEDFSLVWNNDKSLNCDGYYISIKKI